MIDNFRYKFKYLYFFVYISEEVEELPCEFLCFNAGNMHSGFLLFLVYLSIQTFKLETLQFSKAKTKLFCKPVVNTLILITILYILLGIAFYFIFLMLFLLSLYDLISRGS